MFENIFREKLNKTVNQKAFDITTEKNIAKKLDAHIIPSELHAIDSLNRDKVTEIIKSSNYSVKSEFLAILFWGYFFQVNYKNNQLRLLNWLKEPDSTQKLELIKNTIQESDDPNNLFRCFTNQKQLKIPGLGYAYFTKLFYFYTRERNKILPILDKWLSLGWIVLSAELNGDDDVLFYYKNKDNRLGSMKRKQSLGYAKYVKFMDDTAKKFNTSIESLEIAMFGSDLRVHTDDNNIRNHYIVWLTKNNFTV